MKKILVLLLAVGLVFSMSVPAFADGDVDVTINGEYVEFDDDYGFAFIDKNNRTQVPLRITMESMGADVSWDNSTRTAIVKKNGITVKVPIGSRTVYVNGKAKQNDTVAVIKGNRTYLPIRIVAESLGAKVFWDAGSYTVVISTNGNSAYEHYGELLTVYKNWAKQGWQTNYTNGNKTLIGYVEDSETRAEQLDLKEIGYWFWDLNGDGKDELIIGRLGDDYWTPNLIYELYTYDKRNSGHPVKYLIGSQHMEHLIELSTDNHVYEANVIPLEFSLNRDYRFDGSELVLLREHWDFYDEDTDEYEVFYTDDPQEYSLDYDELKSYAWANMEYIKEEELEDLWGWNKMELYLRPLSGFSY